MRLFIVLPCVLLLLAGCSRASTPSEGESVRSQPATTAPLSAPSEASAAPFASAPFGCSATSCRDHWACRDGGCARDPAWEIAELAVGGATFGCARYANGQVWCAGQNSMAQLGRGTRAAVALSTPIEGPAPVLGIDEAVRVVAGVFHACALGKDGHVRCWGLGTSGEVGSGSFDVFPTPVEVTGLTDAVDLAAGNAHTCAVRAGGQVVCWGSNERGQLGDGTTARSARPVSVKGLAGAKELALGPQVSCARTSAGGVICWGILGGKAGLAAPVAGAARATVIAANQNGLCALLGEGVTCFAPGGGTAATTLGASRRLAGGNQVMCALGADGRVACLDGLSPGTAPAVRQTEARVLAVGGAWECVVRKDEQVQCNGELPARGVLEQL